MKTQRRSVLKNLLASVAGIVGFGAAAKAMDNNSVAEKKAGNITYDQDVPLFSGNTTYNGLVFIAGKGAHFEGDIASHTDHVLNEVDKGRFGKNPPVRTTVAVAKGGVPGDSLVEIDCIAYK